jgi:hypothetical protein
MHGQQYPAVMHQARLTLAPQSQVYNREVMMAKQISTKLPKPLDKPCTLQNHLHYAMALCITHGLNKHNLDG